MIGHTGGLRVVARVFRRRGTTLFPDRRFSAQNFFSPYKAEEFSGREEEKISREEKEIGKAEEKIGLENLSPGLGNHFSGKAKEKISRAEEFSGYSASSEGGTISAPSF